MLPKYRKVEKIPEAVPDMPASTVDREETCMLVKPTPEASPPKISETIKNTMEWD